MTATHGQKVTLYSAFGSVVLGSTNHELTHGEPFDAGPALKVEAHNGITEFQIIVNGDEPSCAFVRVEGTSQETVNAFWFRLAVMVSHAEWWK